MLHVIKLKGGAGSPVQCLYTVFIQSSVYPLSLQDKALLFHFFGNLAYRGSGYQSWLPIFFVL